MNPQSAFCSPQSPDARAPSEELELLIVDSGHYLDYLANNLVKGLIEDRQASIGLRARTGRAIAVVLVGAPERPRCGSGGNSA
jgi:hypothetical protein